MRLTPYSGHASGNARAADQASFPGWQIIRRATRGGRGGNLYRLAAAHLTVLRHFL